MEPAVSQVSFDHICSVSQSNVFSQDLHRVPLQLEQDRNYLLVLLLLLLAVLLLLVVLLAVLLVLLEVLLVLLLHLRPSDHLYCELDHNHHHHPLDQHHHHHRHMVRLLLVLELR